MTIALGHTCKSQVIQVRFCFNKCEQLVTFVNHEINATPRASNFYPVSVLIAPYRHFILQCPSGILSVNN